MHTWPQWTMLAYIALVLFGHLVKDQKKDDFGDRVTSVLASFTVAGGMFGILWAGGFWDAIGLR